MKKEIIILLTLAVILLTACAEKPALDVPVACTLDAKVCPDGSAVGRVAPDCEFEACPVVVETEPVIVGGDRDEHGCIASAGYTWCESKQECVREWEEACDEVTPEPEDEPGEVTTPTKEYRYTNPEMCRYADLNCPEGTVSFFEEEGCGCISEELAEPKKNFCMQKEGVEYKCTDTPNAVCGWFDNAKVQCIKTPCAQKFINSCKACQDLNVQYWTEGACPE